MVLTFEKFEEIFDNNMDTETQVMLWNDYAMNEDADREIFTNDEDFLNEFFTTPYDAVRAAYFGDYKFNDNYVWFNGYANLETSDYLPDIVDKDDLFEYLKNNPSTIQDYSEFEDFDSVGDEDDEEEEEGDE